MDQVDHVLIYLHFLAHPYLDQTWTRCGPIRTRIIPGSGPLVRVVHMKSPMFLYSS